MDIWQQPCKIPYKDRKTNIRLVPRRQVRRRNYGDLPHPERHSQIPQPQHFRQARRIVEKANAQIRNAFKKGKRRQSLTSFSLRLKNAKTKKTARTEPLSEQNFFALNR